MLKPVRVPRAGGEKELLLARLHNARAVMEWKVAGLSEEDARRPVVPSGTNLAGLLSHLATAEIWWFGDVMAAGHYELAEPLGSWMAGVRERWAGGDRDAEFSVPESEPLSLLFECYELAVALSDQIAGRFGLDDVADVSRNERWWEGSEPPSLRWVLVHMIGETERHAGHADLARELVDGATGYQPPEDAGWVGNARGAAASRSAANRSSGSGMARPGRRRRRSASCAASADRPPSLRELCRRAA